MTINTTFFVANAHLDVFLNWLSNKYVPKMLDTSHFSASRLYKVLAEQEPGTSTFSLQFDFATTNTCKWEEIYQPALQEELKLLFNENVLSFSTLLEKVEIVN